MIVDKIMVEPLKGPFHIQNGEGREQRIQIMRTYTPEQFQVTPLKVLNELRLEFESYQEKQLAQIYKNLQREIQIKTALAWGVPQIKNMNLDELDTNIINLQCLRQDRLNRLIVILQGVYQRRIQNIKYQRKLREAQNKSGIFECVGSLFRWLPSSSGSSSKTQTKVGKLGQAHFLEQEGQSFLPTEKSADKNKTD